MVEAVKKGNASGDRAGESYCGWRGYDTLGERIRKSSFYLIRVYLYWKNLCNIYICKIQRGKWIMKRIMGLLSAFLMISVLLVGCGTAKTAAKPDYTTEQFEAALNKGDNVVGKTVSVKVETLVPNSAFGYNIEAGKHLNFVSSENPNVKKGDTVIVKATKVASTLGSYVITYEKQ